MPRQVFITTCVLVLLAGLGGFWLGQRHVPLENATGVIEAVAAEYMKTHGGDERDCVGWLQDDGTVLNVRCGEVLYHVDSFGRVRQVEEDGI